MKLNEAAVVKKVSDKTGLNPYMTRKVIDVFWDEMMDEMKDGNMIALHGKGKFFIKMRKGHALNLPNADAPQRMEDYPVVTFIASKQYGRQLRKEYVEGKVKPYLDD